MPESYFPEPVIRQTNMPEPTLSAYDVLEEPTGGAYYIQQIREWVLFAVVGAVLLCYLFAIAVPGSGIAFIRHKFYLILLNLPTDIWSLMARTKILVPYMRVPGFLLKRGIVQFKPVFLRGCISFIKPISKQVAVMLEPLRTTLRNKEIQLCYRYAMSIPCGTREH